MDAFFAQKNRKDASFRGVKGYSLCEARLIISTLNWRFCFEKEILGVFGGYNDTVSNISFETLFYGESFN